MARLLGRRPDGAAVTTLTAAVIGVGVLTGAAALVSGLAAWHAALLAVLVPLALSAAAAAAVGFFLAIADETTTDPYPSAPPPGERAEVPPQERRVG